MFRESSSIDSERTASSVRSLYAKYSEDDGWFDGTPGSVDRRIAQAQRISNIAKQASVRLSGRNAASQYIALAGEMDGDRRALEGLRRDLLTAAADREDGLEFLGKMDTTGWSGADALKYIRMNPDQRHYPDQAYICRCPQCTDRDPSLIHESAFLDLHSFDPIVHERTEGAPRHPLDALHHQVGRDMVHADDILEDNGVKPPGYFSRVPGKHRASARNFIAEQECDDLRELIIRAHKYAEDLSSTMPQEDSRSFVRSFVGAVIKEYQPPRQQRTASSRSQVQDFPDFLMYED